MRRLAIPLFVFLAWTPAAYAWSWPVQGPVLQPFTYDEAHPYAAGQHRGVDIGADAAGETVLAPAAGTVSFSGSVAANGRSVTIETADGYSVTLTHLGSIGVGKGATVAEGDTIGTVGPSGTPEVDGPYVHLGIRVTADSNGYVDPLSLLPPVAGSGTTTTQTTTTSAASATPAGKPARSVPRRARAATPRGSTAETRRVEVSVREHGRAQTPRTNAEPRDSANRPTVRDARAPVEVATPRPRVRRPFDEPAVHDIGHELRASAPAVQTNTVLGLVCNWLAALAAVGAAVAASRRRRRSSASPTTAVEVLRLPPRTVEHRPMSRAA
jgi:pyruvate/2-oxoglutarate dehydrogenase complex dihydrolipoamide acyltransferase (E2) component